MTSPSSPILSVLSRRVVWVKLDDEDGEVEDPVVAFSSLKASRLGETEALREARREASKLSVLSRRVVWVKRDCSSVISVCTSRFQFSQGESFG